MTKIIAFLLPALLFITSIGCDKNQNITDQNGKNIQDCATGTLAPEDCLPARINTHPVPDDPAATTMYILQPDVRKWWHDAVTYQVWLRSFYDSDGDGNGDFNGLAAKLDHIIELGADTIWLSPIFESPSYHGYNTTNFYAVEPDFGTLQDFENLVKKAKEKNLRIILDLVINNVSDQHPWFKQSLAKEGKYTDYFVWSDQLPAGYGKAWSDEIDSTAVWHHNDARAGWYYGVFGWGEPDLNYNNPEVVKEIKEVATFWLNKGVDGFRLDAIRYVIEEGGMQAQADTQSTVDFWTDFNSHIKSVNPDALLIGEALTDTKQVGLYFNQGKGIDSAFNFAFSHVVTDALTIQPDLPNAYTTDDNLHSKNIRYSLMEEIIQRFHTAPNHFFTNFLNNHDQDRISYLLNGDITRAKIAAALLLTTHNAPFIYYGEEIGMLQHAAGDDMYRRALMQWDESTNAGFNKTGERWLDNNVFPWITDFSPWWDVYWQNLIQKTSVAQQKIDGDSLFSFYQSLISLRKTDTVLGKAEKIGFYDTNSMAWVIRYVRGGELRWIVINLDPVNATEFQPPTTLTGTMLELLSNTKKTLTDNLKLSPGEAFVLKPLSTTIAD